jgi:predicted HTH domain antitoxin
MSTVQSSSDLLQLQVKAARESGFYASEADMIADAIRTLLAARPDIRLASACRLYEQGEISLGKAAELAGVDIVSFKEKLHDLGVERVDPESLDEITLMARQSLEVKTVDVETKQQIYQMIEHPIYQISQYAVDTGIPDLAVQHDHYLYGTDKRDA